MPRHHLHTVDRGAHRAATYDNDEQQDGPIYTRRTAGVPQQPAVPATRPAARTTLSAFLGHASSWRKPKITQITTAPGQLGAGETETEADEPVSTRVTLVTPGSSKHPQPTRLPTSRIMPMSQPLVPPNVVTMLLFESSRLLSVVPAACGVVVNAWCLWCPPGYSPTYGSSSDHFYNAERTEAWGRRCPPDRGDYFIAVLWVRALPLVPPISYHATIRQALLTAHQCLKLTTGLLHRWRAYYSPLSTLIRLLALQAICWPATHFTLDIVGSLGSNAAFSDPNLTLLESALLRWTTARPDICWAVIGTTTCVSRSIQIWVTSNLLLSTSSGSRTNLSSAIPDRLRPRRGGAGEETRKLTGRKWDWRIVAKVCMLPAGCLYFVMAWIAAWRREAGGC